MHSASPIGFVQASDTVLMLQVRDGLGTFATFANIGLAAAVTVILILLIVLLFQLRAVYATVLEFTGWVHKGLDPMFDQTREATANVESMTSALRADVRDLGDSLRLLSERVRSASDRVERRIRAFDALLEAVQTEAEDLFVASAAAAHGLRASARSLGGSGSAPDLADTALDTAGEDHGPAKPEQERAAGPGQYEGEQGSGECRVELTDP